jgi:hypothetical protein
MFTALSVSAMQREVSVTALPIALVPEAADWARLNAGGVLVTILPPRSRELTVFSATRVDADGAQLAAAAERLDFLQNRRYLRLAGRFSEPPRLEDLCTLVLSEGDLDDIRSCRPGACDLKLGDAEIASLHRTIASTGPRWRPATQIAFRQLVLDRLLAYRGQGHAAVPPYHDKRQPTALDAEFGALVAASPWLTLDVPDLPDYLIQYPRMRRTGVEEFFYWSVEAFGGKPIFSVTHASVITNDDSRLPGTIVAAKQVFATHYMTGSLAVFAIVGSAHAPRLLVYLNRTRVDVFDGAFAGLLRRHVESRIRSEAPGALDEFRRRVERGPSRD